MFEEVKEMIDSTIYTNGRGEVTAQNVNLAMHGMVDATEEELGKVNDAVKTVEDKVTALEENGTGGGSGALRVWLYEVDINELTQEQVNENIATYNSLLKDVAQPVVIGMYYSSSNEGLTTTIGQSMVCNVAVQVHEYDGEKIELVSFSASDFEVLLNPDGTIELVPIDEPSTPASNGPLRVWINEAKGGSITEEQRTENLASLDAIINGTGGVLKVMYTLDDVLCTLIPSGYYGFAAEGAVISVYAEGQETYYILGIDGSVTIE